VDESTLAIANSSFQTVSLYTIKGKLKRHMATNIVSLGLAVCADACLLISDHFQKRIRVFSLDGNELVTPLSEHLFKSHPCEIALFAEHAYVFEELCQGLSRICVFK
jgi:hypothetical protein